MLAYDTWDDDAYTDTSYRIVDFPSTAALSESKHIYAYYSIEHYADKPQATYWLVFAFSFLTINNNARCPLPLPTAIHRLSEWDLQPALRHYIQPSRQFPRLL